MTEPAAGPVTDLNGILPVVDDEFPGGEFESSQTTVVTQPLPTPRPVLNQNATWLARTIDDGTETPSFVEAEPPPPSIWEEGVIRPEVESVPSFSAATVLPPPPMPDVKMPDLTTQSLNTAQWDINFADDVPELMIDTSDGQGSVVEGQNPNPASFGDMTVVEI